MRRVTAFRRLGGALALVAGSPAHVRAQTAGKPVTLAITGKTASAWPTYVATEMGFFTANGLAVDVVIGGSSASTTQQLSAGSADIGDVSSTQCIQAIVGGAPIVVVCDRSRTAPYYLFGKKGVTSLQQLKGKTMIIGGPNDITRIFTDTMIKQAKLDPADVNYTYAGGAAERYAALVSGAVDASILNAPFMFRAQDQGFPVIGDVLNVFPQFPFVWYAANTSWAKAHPDTLMALIKANVQSTQWLYNPKNRARAVQILAETTNSPAADAERTYDYYIKNVKFYLVNGEMAPSKVQVAIDAVMSFKLIAPPPPPPSRFYDNSYVRAVNAQMKST